MPLSSDPEKRARSLANLKKGPSTAAKKFGLDVVGYDEPAQAPSPPKAPRRSQQQAPAEPAQPKVSEPAAPAGKGGPSMLLVLGGGIALLVLLVVILDHTGSPRAR